MILVTGTPTTIIDLGPNWPIRCLGFVVLPPNERIDAEFGPFRPRNRYRLAPFV